MNFDKILSKFWSNEALLFAESLNSTFQMNLNGSFVSLATTATRTQKSNIWEHCVITTYIRGILKST